MAKREIKIEVDCNNDIVNLYDNEKLIDFINIKNSHETIDFLSELFNRLIQSDGMGIHYLSITKIDEDSDTTIEEW